MIWHVYSFAVVCVAATVAAQTQEKPDPTSNIPWELSMYWGNDVYSGGHFNELVTGSATGDVIKQHTLLVMYDRDCFQGMLESKMTPGDTVPKLKYLVYARYNMQDSPRHVWYPLTGDDDLTDRYVPKDNHHRCPHVFFFKAGTKVMNPIQLNMLHNNDSVAEAENFSAWLWEMYKVRFEILNNLAFEITASATGEGPLSDKIVIGAGQRVSVEAHVSQKMVLSSSADGSFVGGFVVEYVMANPYVITNEWSAVMKQETKDQWVEKSDALQRNESFSAEESRRSLAYYYLRLFKQPVLLPKFNYDGYERMRMPEDLYKFLVDYYNQGKSRVTKGGCRSENGEPLDVPCDSLTLPSYMRGIVHYNLFSLVDKWAGRPCEMAYVWGMNIFHQGASLPHYIGRVEHNIISVVLPLVVNLNGKEDWRLTIRDHNGRVRSLFLQPGDLLIYEGATVEMAREEAFQGQDYVLVTAHFRPQRWNWRYFDHETKFTDDSKYENLEIFNTPLTFKYDKRVRDEL